MKSAILFNEEAREKILRGATILYQAVSTTLGARGRNVGYTRGDNKGNIFGREIVHDGVSVARAIDLTDEFENFGAQVLKEAAQKTVDEVGDGTTVTVILAHAILKECFKAVATGENPMALRKGLEEGLEKLIAELPTYTKKLTTLKEKVQIATISAEDPELGELIAQTLDTIGVDGVVTIEESRDAETTVTYQTGLQFDKGYYHQLFVTDPNEQIAVAENTYILVTDMDITSLEEMAEILNAIATRNATLTIISPNIGGEALPLLLQNKLAGKLKVLAVQAPSFGDNQKNILQDIALLTDAKYVTKDAGHTFKELTLTDLGFAKHITSTKSETIIVEGRGTKKTIKERTASIKKQLKEEGNDFNREKLRERYAKLTNGVAVISVGGHTEIEMRERKERVDDSVHALKAAMEKGIVPGGEMIFLHIRQILGDSLPERILHKALEKPFIKLVENAGFDGGQYLERIQQVGTFDFDNRKGFGINVIDGSITEMLEVGIIDPVLVPERALYNALSVAIQLMTTGAIIVPEITAGKEDK